MKKSFTIILIIPDKILKILSKAKSNEEKHMILFNLPEVLRA
jgi:hypothetical protein